jgi:hypothetical protein
MSYEECKQDLDTRIKGSAAGGNINKMFANVFVAIGVCASAITTISVAAGTLTPFMNAVLAALPGIVVMVLKTFKFEQRSRWWWEKYHGVLDIKAGLLPDGSNEREINRQLAKFLTEHHKKWTDLDLGFGNPPMDAPAAP